MSRSRQQPPEASSQPRFHAATFQMHGHPLARNRARIAEVDRWEEKHGIQLPAAVREWYEFEGNDLWERIHPRDFVPALDNDKLKPLSETERDAVESLEPYKYLLVYADTDVGTPFLVRIDGTDDPPVFVLLDGEAVLDLSSQRYSVFQFDQLADHVLAGFNGELILKADDRLPTDAELAQLCAAFVAGPVSQGGWPGWQHRFFTDKLLIACGHDYYARPAEKPFWEVRAAYADALRDALRIVWPMANLCRTLRIADGAAAAPVLQQIARETGLGQWPATTKDWLQLGYHSMEQARRRRERELWRSAVECFNEAVKLGETWFGLFEQRAECHRALGQYDEALRDYDQANQKDPHHRLVAERVTTLLLAGRFDEAFADMVGLIKDLKIPSLREWADQLHQAKRDDLVQQVYLELKRHPEAKQIIWVQNELEEFRYRLNKWGVCPAE